MSDEFTMISLEAGQGKTKSLLEIAMKQEAVVITQDTKEVFVLASKYHINPAVAATCIDVHKLLKGELTTVPRTISGNYVVDDLDLIAQSFGISEVAMLNKLSQLVQGTIIAASRSAVRAAPRTEDKNPRQLPNGHIRKANPIMQYFEYGHLPEKLQKVSKPIGDLAYAMDHSLPDGPEKSAGLRKLLEAKDCLVRAGL